MNWGGCVHLVIGPDLEKKAQDAELAPYPRERFGGYLLDQEIRVSGISSDEKDGSFNNEENFKLMLSDASVVEKLFVEKKWWSGCRTREEDAPWIELELTKPRQIMGIQVDVFNRRNWCRPLRIWMSNDLKRWVEIYREDRELGRFVADFTKKTVKGKYIRVGREPGQQRHRLTLDKILIYGK